MNFFYSAGAMGYGENYWWHRFFDFPKLPFVTKTLTLFPTKGNKYLILPIGNSVFNRVGLDNIGIHEFIKKYKCSKMPRTISIAGPDRLIKEMVELIDYFLPKEDSIELNFSCPNIKPFNNRVIPETNRDLYLKLNCTQSPYSYDRSNIKGIRLNSISLKFCGGSGKIAQKKNWKLIKMFNRSGLNAAGCSIQNVQDIQKLEDIGCKEIGIGSIMLTNPRFVEKLKFHDRTRKGCDGKNL